MTVTHSSSSRGRIYTHLRAYDRRWGSGSWAVAVCVSFSFQKKIAFEGVYVTDPVVATFSGPELTDWGEKCATLHSVKNQHAFYKREMQCGA